MLQFLFKNRNNNTAFTLRFWILAIFISLFFGGTLLVIGFNYYRLSSDINATAIKLIKQAAIATHRELIDKEMNFAAAQGAFSAKLIQQGVIDTSDFTKMSDYIQTLLSTESLPIVQSIAWGDENGNYISQKKNDDGHITTEIIHRTGSSVTYTSFYRNQAGNIIKTDIHNKITYDPRERTWYLAAKQAKEQTWTDIFVYQLINKGLLGIAITTPVYKPNNQLQGVFLIGIRLDYLGRAIQNIKISDNSFMYVVTGKGKIIATSKEKKPQTYLVDIYSQPMSNIRKSFDYFKKYGKKEFVLSDNNKKYVVSYTSLSSFIPQDWLIGIIVPREDFVGELRHANISTLWISLIILGLGIVAILILSGHVVKPLKKLVEETERIRNFELTDTLPIRSKIKEVTAIADGIYTMKQGLRSFQKYVPATLVRQLIETGQDAHIGGDKKQLAIFFSDIKNFTTLAEHMHPNQLMRHLCKYLDELSKIIDKHGGTIDKYIGDSIMAFWGAPLPEQDPCQHAARAALEGLKHSRKLNAAWTAKGKPVFFTRIGLHLGEAVVGNVGSSERLNYTAIGDAINLASRLEGANKMYGTQIIVSESVYKVLQNEFVLRMLDRVIVKGKKKTNYIYELLAEKPEEVTFDVEKYNNFFIKGFSAYEQQQWNEAIGHFNNCLQIYPEDTVAPIFIQRCNYLKSHPPKNAWDGIWRHKNHI
ncbi:MAG: hypothetical protein ACD_46C00523G0003 [uncultured bacterium]|nr:MAG: hypothetical protein ACD_46C00523G0003 [uncultured bacterium]